MKITKVYIANLGSAVVGVLLANTRIPIVQRVGVYLLVGSSFIALYRIYKKAKAEKKEVF